MTAWVDRLAEIGLGGFLHLLQDEGADLGGRVFLAAALDPGVAIIAGTILYGTRSMSFATIGSSKRRPISRLIAKNVFSGLVTAWRFAAWPTRRSPDSVNATIDGVVRAPSAVLDDLGGLAFHHGDARIRRAEIDADNFAHGNLLSKAGPVGPEKHRPDPPGNDRTAVIDRCEVYRKPTQLCEPVRSDRFVGFRRLP